MLRRVLSGLIFLGCALSGGAMARAEEPDPSETARIACLPPSNFNDTDDDLHLDADARRPPANGGWSQCEKWVWSCIRRGEEANLYARSCVTTRSKEAGALRDAKTLSPFEAPDRLRVSNALGSQFVADMLHKDVYAGQLTPNGVRIVGAYFGRQLSLENVTTGANLVLDQSVFKGGIRLTNFKSEKNVSLDGSNVRGNVLMNRMRLAGSLFLEDGVYDHIDLRDARIGASIDAPGSFFVGTVRLDRARVEGKVNFVNARLTELSGWDLVVGGSLWLRNADIRGRIDLTGARIASDLRMQKVTFGRRIDGARDLCDWDLSQAHKLFLDDINKPGQEDRLRAVLSEILDGRPNKGSSFDMCAGQGGAKPAALAEPRVPTPLTAAEAKAAAAKAEASPTALAEPSPDVGGIDAAAAGRAPNGAGHTLAAAATAAPSLFTHAPAAKEAPHPPAEAPAQQRKTHEVRLRDMTIDGTLCLIDLSGEFGTLAPPVALSGGAGAEVAADGPRVSSYPDRRDADIESVSIDGTQARSTIVRWKPSDSRTLWRAVQFKTGNLIIDLGAQPKRHYIDALDIKNISFLRSDGRADPPPEDEDFLPYLCDMRPGTDASATPQGSVGLDSASREAHERIVKFFASPANESRSAQPFTKIAERLNESGASSIYLKMELGDFTSRRRCASSELFKEYERTPPQQWSDVWLHVRSSFARVSRGDNLRGWRDWIDESKNVTLDFGCRGMFKAYKYTAAYGHQPHNVFIVIGIFVVIFWGLLRLDVPRNPELGGRGDLGMLYAIDMFVPFVKLNADHAVMKPQKRWLRGYLIAHRVIGLVLTSLLVLGFYVQRH